MPSTINSSGDVEAVLKAFHARHKELYTFNLPFRGIEFLTFWLKVTCARKLDLKVVPLAQGKSNPAAAVKRKRRCLFGKEWIETPCYDGERLLSGNVIPGPGIIEERVTTVVIPKGFTCTVDASGTYLLKRS